MRRIAILTLFAAGALAQEDDAAKASRRDEILAALDLPASAQALRDKGVDKAEVKEALRAAKGKGLKARETRGLMKNAETAVDEHGPVDNFGAFVKTQLESGLRGRELAAAIKAEHAARGKGKGHGRKDGAGRADKEPKQRGPKEKGDGDEEAEEETESQKDRPGGGKPERDQGAGKPERDQDSGKPEREDDEQGGGRGKGQGGGKGRNK